MRRRGFTLIELLVVIAIIGILAAMLFPVFARARESARKTQCLANVKNIATAIQMYFSDYDKGFPGMTDRTAIDYFNTIPGGKKKDPMEYPDVCNHTAHADPYLRRAVVLEDYVKSREVWKCPSARYTSGAGCIIPMGRDGYWLNAWKDTEGTWGTGKTASGTGPCYVAWPSGWGGDVTDSLGQLQTAETGSQVGNNVFVQGVGVNDALVGLNLSNVGDSARYIACGDAGKVVDLWSAECIAVPDQCVFNFCGGDQTGFEGNGGPCPAACATAQWDNASCGGKQACGMDPNELKKLWRDASLRKTYYRHMGGSNVGFMDGHAKWFQSDVLLTGMEPFKDPQFEGMCSCWYGNGKGT